MDPISYLLLELIALLAGHILSKVFLWILTLCDSTLILSSRSQTLKVPSSRIFLYPLVSARSHSYCILTLFLTQTFSSTS